MSNRGVSLPLGSIRQGERDGLLEREGPPIGPGYGEGLLAQRRTHGPHSLFVAGLPLRHHGHAEALPEGLGRATAMGRAVMALSVDSSAAPNVLQQIAAMDGMEVVRQVEL